MSQINHIAKMAPTNNFLFLCLILLVIISASAATTSFRPNALVLPVTKDERTKQYTIVINQRTPPVPVKTTIHLGGMSLWVNCEQGYTSSTFKHSRCGSKQCKLAGSRTCTTSCLSSRRPGCANHTCAITLDNQIVGNTMDGELGRDVVSIPSTDGSNPGKVASASDVLFACADAFMLEGLAQGVQGMAGLGRNKISLPYQLSSTFSFHNKFSLCLSPSTSANGVLFFGDGPYNLLPNIDASKSLVYTPLILNPVGTAGTSFYGDPSMDYFIGVKSIEINGNPVKFNTTLLSIDREGYGGTMISTITPYTVLETSIYQAVTKAFAKELSQVPTVAAVAPFSLCYNSKNIKSTKVGPAVPQIDLVLQNSSAHWSIFGVNSMVQVSDDVLCLGFLNGGEGARTPIVIGGHQLEDNLLQFDLAASKLGFSSSLLSRKTTCANFNFATKA